MTDRQIKIINELGFSECYPLAPSPIPNWDPGAAKGATGLFGDPREAYPRAKSILLLVYPYRTFAPEEPIPAYYPASNAAYFAAKELIGRITEEGFYAERANIPLRAFALANNIGDMGKNGLLRIPPYGSCFILDAVATDWAEPEQPEMEHMPCPEGCAACAAACPTGAISHSRDIRRCMRLRMDNPLHPEDIRPLQRHYIGCEECMRACPYNIRNGYAEPTDALREAFDTLSLIQGKTAAARKLVGKNMTGGGKLTAEAIAMAGRRGEYREDIEKALNSPFEAVKAAAEWALNKYFSKA